jgi:hypothetical protein
MAENGSQVTGLGHDELKEMQPCACCEFNPYKGWGLPHCFVCGDANFLVADGSFPLVRRLAAGGGEFNVEKYLDGSGEEGATLQKLEQANKDK